jgi:hypothetical protein
MARLRHDPSARGLLYEPFWIWLTSGQPVTAESERYQYSGLEWWLTWMFTRHWHPCYACGETLPARVLRLLTTAVDQGLVGLCDDKEVALDDGNTKAIIQVLDELEPPSSWEWWRDHDCPACKQVRLEAV